MFGGAEGKRQAGTLEEENLCGRRVDINRVRVEITPAHPGPGNQEAFAELWNLQHGSIFTGNAVGKALQPGAAQDLCPAPLTDQRDPEQRNLYALTY